MEQQNTNTTPNFKEKIQVWLPLMLAASMSVGIFLGLKMQDETLLKRENQQESIARPDKLDEVLHYVQAKYVDEIDVNDLTEKTLNALLERLDPHSYYLSSNELEDAHNHLAGSFVGIGIEFETIKDTITVISPIQGGPAQEAGMVSGDKIVSINDTLVAGPNRDIFGLSLRLKGPKNTKVKVGVLRRGEAKPRFFNIIRREITVSSIKSAYMIDRRTGYICIATFSETTGKDFNEALRKLTDAGMKDLVLDLRQNPGGFLDEAVDILNQFFHDKGKLLVYTEGRTVRRTEYKTTGRAGFDIGKIAVLIDEGSASASEIIAGAVQDLDRGIVVGRKSFGKGLVQEEYPIDDRSALRLTVARYYTPSGRCVQRPYTDRAAYKDHLPDTDEQAARKSTDTVQTYFTASQRVVYGGGGIIPDYWVPTEREPEDGEYYGNMLEHVRTFSLYYVGQHRKELPSKPEQLDDFRISNTMLKEFYDYAIRRGAVKDKKRFAQIQEFVRNDLRSRIALICCGDEGLIRVTNETDPILRKAQAMMRLKDPFAQSAIKRRK